MTPEERARLDQEAAWLAEWTAARANLHKVMAAHLRARRIKERVRGWLGALAIVAVIAGASWVVDTLIP
jgi:hypothetical protein